MVDIGSVCCISKENIYVRSGTILHVVRLWESNEVLKRILPVTKVFQGAYRLFLLQIGLFCYGGEKHVSLERKSSLLEA
jgi:hypothetical protein